MTLQSEDSLVFITASHCDHLKRFSLLVRFLVQMLPVWRHCVMAEMERQEPAEPLADLAHEHRSHRWYKFDKHLKVLRISHESAQ